MRSFFTNKLPLFLTALILSSTAAICPAQSLTAAINRIISDKSQKNAVFGIKIINADTGTVLYGKNPDEPLIPASNMKLITSYCALQYLGPEFRYQTIVGLDKGNLVIIGSGDPLLGDLDTDQKIGRQQNWVFDEIIKKLKA